MNKLKTLLIVLLVSLIALVGVAVYSENQGGLAGNSNSSTNTSLNKKETKKQKDETEKPEETTTEKVEPEKSTATIVAVGDVLIHTPLLAEGLQADGSYDFKFLFEIMKDDFQSADIAIVNQESVLGGPEIGYDGYPNFNSPDEVGDEIINAGFDIVQQASNHAMDVGTQGITNCIEFWNKRSDKITMVGFNSSAEEAYKPKYLERNGIKIAFFNFTYGLNGYALPAEQSYLVNLLDDEHKDQIIANIQEADKEADFVVALPHWGNEDWLGDVSDWQINWANILTDAGVDLILGTHPHVLEKIEWIETSAGNKSLCYYSLGNYISNQQELPEVLGGMAKVTIVKEDGKTYIDESTTGIVPTVTQNDRTNGILIQTYHLKDYTEEMAVKHDIFNRFDASFSAAKLNETAKQVLGDWILES